MKLKLVAFLALYSILQSFNPSTIAAQNPVKSRGVTPPRNLWNFDQTQGTAAGYDSKFGQMMGVKRYSSTAGDTLVGFVPVYYLGDSLLKVGTYTVLHTGNQSTLFGGITASARFTGVGTSASPLELATVGSAGTCTLCTVSTDTYGRVTSKTNGTVDLSTQTTSTLAATSGGTGSSSYTVGDLLYASGTTALSKRAIGTSGQVLTVSGGLPTWADAPGTNLGSLPAATNATASERLAMTDSTITLQKLVNQAFDSVQVSGYLKTVYAKAAGNANDYNFQPMSVITNDTIWTVFRTGEDHNITGNTTTGGVKLMGISAHDGRLLFEEWVVKDSTNGSVGIMNNCTIGDLGSGKRVVFWTKVTQEGVPGVSPRIKEVFFSVRSAAGTYSTTKRVSGGYLPATNSGWQSIGDFTLGTNGAWILDLYGGYHATTPSSNRNNYDIITVASYNSGNTWTLKAVVANGTTLSRQFEEPKRQLVYKKLSDGTTVPSHWLMFIRWDGGNVIQMMSTASATDTFNFVSPLANNRPEAKFNGGGYPQSISLSSSPGKVLVLTRNKTTSDIPTNARESESVYYISENNGLTWAGPFTVDKRNRASQEKFMYGCPLNFRGDIILLLAQERYGDSGQADIYYRRVPHAELGGDVISKELTIEKIYGAPIVHWPNAGNQNVVFGSGAMGNTPASSATNTVHSNTFLGQNAGEDCTTCRWNVGIGADSTLQNITTGQYWVAIGHQIMGSTSGVTGDNGIAIGERALLVNSSGSRNTAIQKLSLSSNTTGSDNTAVGSSALANNTTGSRNIGIGADSGSGIATGSDNINIGRTPSLGDVSSTIAIGNGTLIADVGFLWAKSSYRLFLAGAGNTSATGSANFGAGREAMLSLTSGSENLALGGRALRSLTTGTNNTAVGYSNITQRGPLESVTTGSYNTAVGAASLSRATGDENTAIGYYSGQAVTTGTRNTLIGNEAGISITTGSNNTFVGRWSGASNQSNSVALSDGSANVRFFANSTGKTVLGGSTVDASAQLYLSATDAGFLPNRVTNTQRNAISSPTGGLMVFNTSSNTWDGYNGSAWGSLLNSTAADASYFKLNGNSFGAHATFGTNDAYDAGWESNGVERLRLRSTGRLTTSSLTDAILHVSDTLSLLSQGATGWILAPATSRLVGASGLLHFDVNNSTGVMTSNLLDNNSASYAVAISGGGTTMLNFNTSNSGERVTLRPVLTVEGTGSATSINQLTLRYDKSGGGASDDDEMSMIFNLDDAAGNETTFGSVATVITAATNGSENGALSLRVMKSGTLTERIFVADNHIRFKGDLRVENTITPTGTTGAQTINQTAGAVNFAAGATSLVVTNSLVSTASLVLVTVATNDATMKSAVAVPGSGSFTIHANAAPTAETRVFFTVFN